MPAEGVSTHPGLRNGTIHFIRVGYCADGQSLNSMGWLLIPRPPLPSPAKKMDLRTLFFASYELLISVVFGLITVYICIKVLSHTYLKSKKGNLLLQGNTAASLFASVMIITVLILVQGSVLPSVDALRTMVLGGEGITFSVVMISFGYFLLFYAIALVISIAIIFLTTQIYLVATVNIDEMNEIRQNNVGVAILLSAVLLAMTLFIRMPVQRFISSLVNYESLERIPVDNLGKKPPPGKEELVVPEKKVMPQ